MTDNTIKINLNDPLIGVDGRPRKNGSRLRDSNAYAKMTDAEFREEMAKKSASEIEALVPNETVGDGMKNILVNGIEPKNNEDAAKMFSYITKINNTMMTSKAEWILTKTEIENLRTFLATATKNINPFYNGQIDTILEQKHADLVKQNA